MAGHSAPRAWPPCCAIPSFRPFVATRSLDPGLPLERLHVVLDVHRLVVIVAGYPAPMERFLNSNPGLRSRFSREIVFPDYSAGELVAITRRFAADNGYTLDLDDTELARLFQQLKRDAGYGNARYARTLFEQALTAASTDSALTDLRLLLLINHAVTLGDLDRHEKAIAAAQKVRQLADRSGSVVRLVQAHSALGQLRLEAGQWDDALVDVDVLPDDLKDPSVVCCDHGVAAIINFHRGDPAAGRRHLAAAEAAAGRIEHRVAMAVDRRPP